MKGTCECHKWWNVLETGSSWHLKAGQYPDLDRVFWLLEFEPIVWHTLQYLKMTKGCNHGFTFPLALLCCSVKFYWLPCPLVVKLSCWVRRWQREVRGRATAGAVRWQLPPALRLTALPCCFQRCCPWGRDYASSISGDPMGIALIWCLALVLIKWITSKVGLFKVCFD